MNEKPILVAAGIIIKDGKILACQRPRGDAYGLQWEFPGGKLEQGESLPDGLRRELFEELDIDAEIGDEVFRIRHRYPDRFVEVAFFAVRAFRGEVKNKVFEAVEWAPRHNLNAYDFLAADRELVARIAGGEII
jgi:8-oxo-dGTP diphosphatase